MSYFRRLARRAAPAALVHDADHIGFRQRVGRHARVPVGVNIVRSHYLPRLTVCFVPEQPLPGALRGAVAYKLCRVLGHGIAKDPSRPHDVLFKYSRDTFSEPLAERAVGAVRLVNGRSVDISKRAVNAAFEAVFGYALGVDPTRHEGDIVVKSNLNSVHDGHMVRGPIASSGVRAENAYQRAIDNTVPGRDAVVDYRVPVYGNRIPLVYLKYRPLGARFPNKSVRAVIRESADVFSESEAEKILQVAQRMGIDYAEFDVLRDKDGRIYVIDANTAPWGPPVGLSAPDRIEALARLGAAFDELLRNHLVR